MTRKRAGSWFHTLVIVTVAVGPMVLFVPKPSRGLVIAAAASGWVLTYLIVRILRSGLLTDPAWRRPTSAGLLHTLGASPRREYVVPAELPPPPGLLLGREEQSRKIVNYLQSSSAERPVVVLCGPDGVGKSALALGVGQSLTERYRDGQLLARLDRLTPGRETADVLRMFVVALGHGVAVPDEDEEQLRRRYQDLTSGRRVLVILDSATSVEQITRLLPGGRGCAALVTTRAEWSARPAGWLVEQVKPLVDQSACLVLNAIVGNGRISNDSPAVKSIIDKAAGNPYALQVVGLALAARQSWSLEAALRDTDQTSVPPDSHARLPRFARALDLACALLTRDERRALALVGLIRGDSFDRWSLSALIRGADGHPAPEDPQHEDAVAERVLERLAQVRLLERWVDEASGVARYRIPEQIAAYVQARAHNDLKPVERKRAKKQLDQERRRRGALTADEMMRQQIFVALQSGRLAAALATGQEAIALCDERMARASSEGERAATRIDRSLANAAVAEIHLELGWLDECQRYAEAALVDEAAAGTARARRCLGGVDRRLRRLDAAQQRLVAADRTAKQLDDTGERIRILHETVLLHVRRRDFASAEHSLAIAHVLSVEDGDPARRRKSLVLSAEAELRRAQGRYPEAEEALRQAEQLCLDEKPHLDVRRPWLGVQRALVALARGEPASAREFARQASYLFRDMQHRYGVAHCRLIIGRALEKEGRPTDAVRALDEALQTFAACGDPVAQLETRLALAMASAKAGNVEAAWRLAEVVEDEAHDLAYVAERDAARKLRSDIRRSTDRDLAPTPPIRLTASQAGKGAHGAALA